MNKLKKNESGFGAVELILVIVVIALLGVVGWMVYKNHKKTPATTPVASTSANTTKQTTNTTQATPTTKYLTIKEWGIRAPYTGSDTLSYTLTTDGGPVEVISSNLSSNYGCTTYGAGLIVRQSPNDTVDPGPDTVAQVAKNNSSSYKQIGGYYYSYVHDKAACGNITAAPLGQAASAGEQAQQDANTFTSTLIPHLEATP